MPGAHAMCSSWCHVCLIDTCILLEPCHAMSSSTSSSGINSNSSSNNSNSNSSTLLVDR